MFDMLGQSLGIVYNRLVISYSLVLGNNHLQLVKYKIFIKVIQYILKSLENFFIRKFFFSNAKRYK